ncbi:hypothetical protein KBC31_00165 [Candidatus Saccharibacteria bacterium]|jgi:hypothetical protein|nr:hypothetical protein [Candidatus Saccharibacteria bacterium]
MSSFIPALAGMDGSFPVGFVPPRLRPGFTTEEEVIGNETSFSLTEVTTGAVNVGRGLDRLTLDNTTGGALRTAGRIAFKSHEWTDGIGAYIEGAEALDSTECSQVNVPGCSILTGEIIDAAKDRGVAFDGARGLYNTLGAIGRASGFHHGYTERELLTGPLRGIFGSGDPAIGKAFPGVGAPEGFRFFQESPC